MVLLDFKLYYCQWQVFIFTTTILAMVQIQNLYSNHWVLTSLTTLWTFVLSAENCKNLRQDAPILTYTFRTSFRECTRNVSVGSMLLSDCMAPPFLPLKTDPLFFCLFKYYWQMVKSPRNTTSLCFKSQHKGRVTMKQ